LKLIFLIVIRAVSVLGLARREWWWKDERRTESVQSPRKVDAYALGLSTVSFQPLEITFRWCAGQPRADYSSLLQIVQLSADGGSQHARFQAAQLGKRGQVSPALSGSSLSPTVISVYRRCPDAESGSPWSGLPDFAG
jgi:hypothetical protein